MQILYPYSKNGSSHNEPDTIVIHAMAEMLNVNDRVLTAREFLESVGLSAHALVWPNWTIQRMRRDDQGAYHARGFNTNSLGIEVLVKGTHDYAGFLQRIDEDGWVEPEQYEALVWQCKVWLAKYKIKRVVRHSDLSPGRKFDPGNGFPWEKFLQDIGWNENDD